MKPQTDNVDLLFVAALKMELDALITALAARGVLLRRDSAGTIPFWRGQLKTTEGRLLAIAAARPTRMGANAIMPCASTLVTRLRPVAIAMSGVCAGNPDVVALGDVVVAELAYAYDEGRRTQKGFEPDHRQIPLDDLWLHVAQDLNARSLPSHGPAVPDAAMSQLLRTISEGRRPQEDRLLDRATGGQISLLLKRAEQEGFILRQDSAFALAEKGRDRLNEITAYEEPSWAVLPFEVCVGPMASGNVVVKDGVTWESLKAAGVRTLAALDMEAAAVAQVAHRLRVPRWVVAKGVMDYADPRKDDRFKPFAARASAEVLLHFLDSIPWPEALVMREGAMGTNVIGDVSGSGHTITQIFKP